ncbi:hypothetical protein L6R52_43510 [Myxococcota bacterium]|nr:hypothetical protein [Myxococcota bacterium]
MALPLRPSLALLLTSLVVACDDGPTSAPIVDATAPLAAAPEEVVDVSVIYDLVGRWYPEAEIARLSDRTLTPEEWCRREPSMIFVVPEKVTVACDDGAPISAMVAVARRPAGDRVEVALRAKPGSPLTKLTFDVDGTRATITGSPCDRGASARYARFPRYELLGREILGGRRCAELATTTEPR